MEFFQKIVKKERKFLKKIIRNSQKNKYFDENSFKIFL